MLKYTWPVLKKNNQLKSISVVDNVKITKSETSQVIRAYIKLKEIGSRIDMYI